MNEVKQQSEFVTVVAWIFIILTGLASAVSILQNIMIRTMFSSEQMREAMAQQQNAEQVPEFAKFMFANVENVFLVILVVFLIMFATSIALLKRRNWARITFIGFMILGVLWNIFGLVMQSVFIGDMPAPPDAEIADQFDTIMSAMRIGTLIFTLGLTALYIWIIVKLSSRAVREEFNPS
jgi:hypothetical protein